jgi:hypothetical protein
VAEGRVQGADWAAAMTIGGRPQGCVEDTDLEDGGGGGLDIRAWGSGRILAWVAHRAHQR